MNKDTFEFLYCIQYMSLLLTNNVMAETINILIRFTEIPTIAPYMSYVRVFPAQILTYIRWNIFSIVIEAHVNRKFCRVYWNNLTSTIG